MNPLPRYQSIETPSKFYDTGSNPIRITISDGLLSSYVVKHNNGRTPCMKLLNELLAYYFLELWQLKTPPAALVDVNPASILEVGTTRCQPGFFRVPCWGTHFIPGSTEFLRFFDQIQSYEREKFAAPFDLLRIILFDIWLSNEDRTSNNPNLLIVTNANGFEFWPIDHEAIFNTGNLARGLYPLTLNDSLLYHPALKKLLGNKLKDNKILEELVVHAYLCIEKCEQNLEEILKCVPEEWSINIQELGQLLTDRIFSNAWKRQLRTVFLSLVQEL